MIGLGDFSIFFYDWFLVYKKQPLPRNSSPSPPTWSLQTVSQNDWIFKRKQIIINFKALLFKI